MTLDEMQRSIHAQFPIPAGYQLKCLFRVDRTSLHLLTSYEHELEVALPGKWYSHSITYIVDGVRLSAGGLWWWGSYEEPDGFPVDVRIELEIMTPTELLLTDNI